MGRWALMAFLAGLSTACGTHELYEGQPEHVERRHLKLEGAPNFRDLGGYATEDGRSVRWQMFYRSDNLAHLTETDLDRVKQLGLQLVCDFRGPDERLEEPDRLPEVDPPAVAELAIFDDSFSSTGFREKLMSGELDDPSQMLVDANRLFISRFSDRYAQMFERLMDPAHLPALVHCTAGKDRAGLASALILRALGVPEATVYDDYLLTNHYVADKIERSLLVIRVMSFFRVDPETIRPLLGVERKFLEAAFDEIQIRHGSFDAFRRAALGVDDAELLAFRDRSLK
jgi:protein-tyrosine phosphatase